MLQTNEQDLSMGTLDFIEEILYNTYKTSI